MSEQQQLKKKTKKTYDERSQEIRLELRRAIGKLGYIYIPELCGLLRDEGKENKEIQRIVTDDWSDVWEASSIYEYLPSWVHDQKQVQKVKKGWETRNANKIKASKTVFDELDKIVIPPAPKPLEPEYSPVSEEFEQKMQELGVSKYGDTGKSIRELMGAISEHSYKLFAALTNNSSPPISDEDDIMVDYIRPSKEFRRGLFLEADKRKRAEMHNILHNVIIAAENTIEIIDEIDNE